jgi:hypothetical protein
MGRGEARSPSGRGERLPEGAGSEEKRVNYGLVVLVATGGGASADMYRLKGCEPAAVLTAPFRT